MTFTMRIALALAATALMPLAPAMAADYDPPIYVDQAPEYKPVEIGSSWYLRGDVAYLPDRTFRQVDFSSPTVNFSEKDRSFYGSVGFGYHFNDYLRADLNVGLFPESRMNATEETVDEIATARVKNSARVAMLNGYIDLGTYVGITPYIGAGIGVMQSKRSLSTNVDDLTPADADVSNSSSKTQYAFAYTLNAGLAYQVSKNVSVDLGYQYLSAPDAEYAALDTAASAKIRKGVDSHQIKVGLRYDLW